MHATCCVTHSFLICAFLEFTCKKMLCAKKLCVRFFLSRKFLCEKCTNFVSKFQKNVSLFVRKIYSIVEESSEKRAGIFGGFFGEFWQFLWSQNDHFSSQKYFQKQCHFPRLLYILCVKMQWKLTEIFRTKIRANFVHTFFDEIFDRFSDVYPLWSLGNSPFFEKFLTQKSVHFCKIVHKNFCNFWQKFTNFFKK